MWRPAALATGTGLASFVVGAVAESVIIRAVHGNRRELLRDAAAGPGPAGVPDWQDDRTVFVFAVEPGP